MRASDVLRVMQLRHTTVLAELAGRRVLVDPCFAPGLAAAGLVDVPPAALVPEQIGPLDLVLITHDGPGGFDAASFARLDVRDATVLVAGEEVARRVRRATTCRRLRVVTSGEEVGLGRLRVTASPAWWPGAEACGFVVDGAGGAVWFTGPLPPLEVEASAFGFALDHPVDVVCGACTGARARGGGPPWLADVDDMTLLAARARAHALVVLGRDARPRAFVSGVVDVTPLPPQTTTTNGLAVVVPSPGVWWRHAPH